jgi:hypothetical protein
VQKSAGNGKEEPVSRCYRRASILAPKDSQFVAQHDDLQLLPLVGPHAEDSELKQPPKQQVGLALSLANDAGAGRGRQGCGADNRCCDLGPFTLPRTSGNLVSHLPGQCNGPVSHSSDAFSGPPGGFLLGELRC